MQRDESSNAAGQASPAQGVKGGSAPARLKKRPEFLRAARGRRHFTAMMTLQATERPETAPVPGAARFGLTVTRKTGNAVVRNRIRRRLREALRLTAMDAQDGCDYVIIAQREALIRRFSDLVADLKHAMQNVNRKLGNETPRGDAPPAQRSGHRPGRGKGQSRPGADRPGQARPK